MPELRQNIATKEWVIIALERSKRPEDLIQPSRPLTEDRPEWDADCPFCPGNEELDLEVMRIPESGSWQLRVVRNKYPALQLEGERKRTFEGVRRQISGVGYHEVLVESPRHNTCPALESPLEVALMLEAFKIRGREIAQDTRIEQIVFFKNHGERAGTSLVHPHTQLIALPIVPYNIRARTEEARRYFDDTGRCVYCHMLSDELRDGHRLVAKTKQFVAFIPYAALSPFHLWILPRRHESMPFYPAENRQDLVTERLVAGVARVSANLVDEFGAQCRVIGFSRNHRRGEYQHAGHPGTHQATTQAP